MPIKLKPLRKIKREIIPPPRVGQIAKGEILSFEKNSLFLDLGPQGVGVIYGTEYQKARSQLKDKKVGDKVLAKVINLENDEGYRELSAVEASREFAWRTLQEKKDNAEVMKLEIKGANKGGLLCDINGIQGFLPVSQLAPENYPKVENAETARIAQALQEFVGKTLELVIIDLDPGKDKLILSEKAVRTSPAKPVKQEPVDLKKYKAGDAVEGEITGVTNFGAFVGIEDHLEGLLKPSEISDEAVPDLKIGQKVKAKIIEVTDDRIYLSLKNNK